MNTVRILLAIGLLAMLVGSAAAETMRPAFADEPYGSAAHDKLDIYLPPAGAPFPAVLFIHGGGWWNGDKSYLPADMVRYFLDRHIAFVSINYRTLTDARQDNIDPPLLAPLDDAKLSLHFIRANAAKFGIDPHRIAVFGGSAGGFSALWVALSASSPDDSVLAVGGIDAQTSLDPAQMRTWVGPELAYGGHAFGLPEGDFQRFLDRRAELLPWIEKLSPAALLKPEQPPIYLYYGRSLSDEKRDHDWFVHSPGFGIGFAELAASRKIAVTVDQGGNQDRKKMLRLLDFLAEHVARQRQG